MSHRHVRQHSKRVAVARLPAANKSQGRRAIVPRTVPDRLCVLVIAQETSCRAAVAGACCDAAVPTTNSVPLAAWSCALPACSHQSS